MEIVKTDATILVVTEHGYGKRTSFDDYRAQNRGGKGIINIKTSARNGKCIAMRTVTEKEEVVCISSGGKIVRTPVSGVSIIGRNTQGVRVIRLGKDDLFVAVAVVMPKEEEESIANGPEDAPAETAAAPATPKETGDDSP
jgi:DNA gyrase subunit A